MADDPLYTDPALARLYDLDNGWAEDRAFCLDLAAGAGSVLDLGCGTGELALRIAAEHGAAVTGVDPAGAMLDLARAKPGAERVRWIEGDARSLRLGQSFDLIVMTGHAFQTLLTRKDRAACLSTIARHLAPGGRFAFDSRNPARREWEDWRPEASERRFDDPVLGPVTAWNDAGWDAARRIVTYATHYRTADGRQLSAASRIAFPPLAELAATIAAAGLAVERWMGDWTGSGLTPQSPEFIPLGGLAAS
jgi:ubiquinone/menaquinone biosynthesis C-methylase UbiE